LEITIILGIAGRDPSAFERTIILMYLVALIYPIALAVLAAMGDNEVTMCSLNPLVSCTPGTGLS
jgi:hypothetical protein